MDYPTDFPHESRDRVELEKITCGPDFDSAKPSPRSIESHLKAYILRIFLVFVNEARALQLWPVDQMKQYCHRFLRNVIADAYLDKDTYMFHMATQSGMWQRFQANLIPDYEKRPEYQKALLDTAEARIRMSSH